MESQAYSSLPSISCSYIYEKEFFITLTLIEYYLFHCKTKYYKPSATTLTDVTDNVFQTSSDRSLNTLQKLLSDGLKAVDIQCSSQ